MKQEGLFGDRAIVVRQGTVNQSHLVSPDLIDAEEDLLRTMRV